MLAAFRTEPIGKSEKVCLIDSVQHHRQRPLDDLVFQGGDSQWPLATICLRYEPTAGGKCSIPPAVNPRMEIPKTSLAIDLVGFPRHPIDAGSRITFQFDECGAEKIDRDVVQERSELLLLLVPCYFSDTFQRMGHAFPVLSPARGLLVRIPLGPALGSIGSATGFPALFANFTATMAGSDFPRPFIVGFGSSPSRHGPWRLSAPRSDMGSPQLSVFSMGYLYRNNVPTGHPSAR